MKCVLKYVYVCMSVHIICRRINICIVGVLLEVLKFNTFARKKFFFSMNSACMFFEKNTYVHMYIFWRQSDFYWNLTFLKLMPYSRLTK